MTTQPGHSDPKTVDKSSITLCIKTTAGDWMNDFPKTMKVADLIQAIIQHFGFSPKGQYEIRLESDPAQPLDPHRPLVSYHISEEDCLLFTDLGTGA